MEASGDTSAESTIRTRECSATIWTPCSVFTTARTSAAASDSLFRRPYRPAHAPSARHGFDRIAGALRDLLGRQVLLRPFDQTSIGRPVGGIKRLMQRTGEGAALI